MLPFDLVQQKVSAEYNVKERTHILMAFYKDASIQVFTVFIELQILPLHGRMRSVKIRIFGYFVL